MAEKIALILTSVDSEPKAHEIATHLIDAHLAACVQVSEAGCSIYRWQMNVEHNREYYLTVKTSITLAEKVETWLATHHDYETPEIIRLDATASDAYASWLHQQIE